MENHWRGVVRTFKQLGVGAVDEVGWAAMKCTIMCTSYGQRGLCAISVCRWSESIHVKICTTFLVRNAVIMGLESCIDICGLGWLWFQPQRWWAELYHGYCIGNIPFHWCRRVWVQGFFFVRGVWRLFGGIGFSILYWILPLLEDHNYMLVWRIFFKWI